jgi:hypothetical protein
MPAHAANPPPPCGPASHPPSRRLGDRGAMIPKRRHTRAQPPIATRTASPGPNRTLAMPTRKRTRAQDRAYRVEYERALNRARYAADPPPF